MSRLSKSSKNRVYLQGYRFWGSARPKFFILYISSHQQSIVRSQLSGKTILKWAGISTYFQEVPRSRKWDSLVFERFCLLRKNKGWAFECAPVLRRENFWNKTVLENESSNFEFDPEKILLNWWIGNFESSRIQLNWKVFQVQGNIEWKLDLSFCRIKAWKSERYEGELVFGQVNNLRLSYAVW